MLVNLNTLGLLVEYQIQFILMLIGIFLSQLILLDMECREKKIIDFMFEHDLGYEDHIILMSDPLLYGPLEFGGF